MKEILQPVFCRLFLLRWGGITLYDNSGAWRHCDSNAGHRAAPYVWLYHE